ncbi:MAG: lipoprotein-releasing ABC transporter permease subunit [Thermodesulfobacteriota bacterium]
MPFELFIGLRYLKAKRKQTFVSVISFISISGVAIGVMALIIVLGVMTGFSDDLRNKILGAKSHLVISQYGAGITNYREIMEKVEKTKDVVSTTPSIYSQVMLSSPSNALGVVLKGIDVDSAPKVTNLASIIKEGNLSDLKGPASSGRPGIILGKELAMILGVFRGDNIKVISPFGTMTPGGMVPRSKEFTVVGIFDSGMYEYDSTLSYISLDNAQHFLNKPGIATGIEVKVKEIYRVKQTSQKIGKKLGVDYRVRDWMEMHKNLYAALKLEKMAMFIILVLIILVAAFNIVGTLIMVVNDKHKDIAILKSMGARSLSIMKIFILEGLIIGLTGTTLGILGGFLLAFLQNTYHIIALPPDVYYISHLLIKITPRDLILVVFSAISITLLATIYPSWQASKLDPVEALRYE